MADNVIADAGSGGATFTTDELTYSGDTAQLPLSRFVHVTGSEGAKTLHEVWFAEDAAHTTGDYGLQFLAVRNDTLAALAGTDGDYTPLQVNASGALYIQEGSALDVSAATVTVDLGSNNDVTIDNSSIVHAEDATHNTGDAGIMPLAVRNDTLAALAGTDGDYAPLQVNASGALFIQEGSALDVSGANVTVVGTGTFVTQVDGDALTALQKIDDAIHVDDAPFTLTTDSVVAIGGVRDDTLANTGTEGDVLALKTNSKGALWVTTETSSTEDAVGASNPIGLYQSMIRQDTPATLTSTDGDVVSRRATNYGAAFCQILDSSGNFVDSFGGGTQYTEDVATANPIVGTATMMERDDALGTLTPIEGDWASMRCSAEGALWVQDFNSDGILADTNTIAGDTTSINGKITACNTGAVVISSGTVTVDAANDGTLNVQIGDGTETALVNASGELLVDEPNLVSTNNSTSATLGISGNYTGTADDVSDYSAITIQVDSSHDSSAGGMIFEWSTDNSNWDDSYAFTYTAADGARRFQFPVTARYFRVNYTNGGTGQSHFRLQTIAHRHPVTSSVHRLGDNTDPDRSCQVVKSAIMAQAAGSGDFVPVDATASGNLKVAIEENDAGNITTNTVQLGGNAIDVGNGGVGSATQRVTIASDSTGVLSVDDNGGSLTVDASQLDVDDLAPTADGVSAALDTSQMMNGLTALTPKFAAIDAASSGDNTLVAAVAGKKIRVLAAFVQSAGTVNVRFEDGAGGTALTGQMNNVANTGFVLPFNPVGWFETTANTLLNLELSGAVSVDGCLTYVEV